MEVHLAVADFNGTVWHAIRQDDGTWAAPTNVNTVAGNPGSFLNVGISGNSDEMHFIGHTVGFFGVGQTLWHAMRLSNDTWIPFVNLNSVLGNPGGIIGFKAFGLAMNDSDLHLGALTSDIWGLNGTIWHGIRHSDGGWTALENVNQVVGNPGSFSALDLAIVRGELHLTGLTGPIIWHAIRHADGSWTGFGDVNAVVGSPAGGFGYNVLAGYFELHLVAMDLLQFRLWHSIRHADGTWTPFEDLMAAIGAPGTRFFSVTLCMAADPMTGEWKLHLVGLESTGVLWYTIRDRTGNWTPLENLSEILGGGPFRSASISGTPQAQERDGR